MIKVYWTTEDIEERKKELGLLNNKQYKVSNKRYKKYQQEQNKRYQLKVEKEKRKIYKGKSGYRLYLKTDWWKERRIKFWEKNNRKCFCCGDYATEIHHNNYGRLFKELDKDLVPLCRKCHKDVHALQKITKKLKRNHIIIRDSKYSNC